MTKPDKVEATVKAALEWGARAPWRTSMIITLVALIVIVPGLAAMPVTDRDEARFAQATKQMLETGDLIDIRFQDQPRWKKPVGIYWLQAATASIVGGVDAPIWAYRLPSALGAWLAALLTAWAVRPLLGPRVALGAGVMLATCVLFAGEANIAKTDAALLASAVAVFGGIARACAGRVSLVTAMLVWVAVAASILLKGPIVPAIAALALVGYWILSGKRPPLARLYPLPGVILTLVLVAPWLIAIYQVSDGAFFAESLGRDMGAKLTSGQEKHWGPPGLYMLLVWATFWPWAAFLPQLAGAVWVQRRAVWAGLALAWVVPFWVVLEIVPTKLPHYILPLYPLLAMTVAWHVWERERPHADPKWIRRLSAILVAVPGAVLGLAVFVLPLIVEGAPSLPGAIVAGLGLVAVFAAANAARQGRAIRQVGASLAAVAFLYPGVLQFGLPSLNPVFASNRLATAIAQYRPCASGPAYSIGYREPSLVFLTETGTRLVAAEQALAALRDDPGAMVLLEHRWRDRLGDQVPDTVSRSTTSYFNYNRGKFESADLLTSDDPRWAACTS